MDITPRQNDFLSELVDLYQLSGRPIHYSTIAEKLGISKWSAYDMMKLLETKGLATSDYNVPGIGKGAGRSSIVFYPTSKGESLIKDLAGGVPEEKGWQKVKEHILANLSNLKGTEYEEVLDKILQKMPTQENSLLYCTDMITALLLITRGFKDKLKGGIPIRTILEDTPKMSGRLITLAGLTIGLSLTGLAAKFKITKILGQTKKYESLVQVMDSRRLKMLSEFLDEAAKILLD